MKKRDLNEEKAWCGSKNFAQIHRRLRRKFERRKPPAFNVVKTHSNANAKFTTYFDTYKTYLYGRVDPVAHSGKYVFSSAGYFRNSGFFHHWRFRQNL